MKSKAVYVISYTRKINREVIAQLESVLQGFEITTIVIHEQENSPVRIRSKPCAAVFILESEALDNRCYCEWMQWCCDTVSSETVFRLFVYLYDLSRVELQNYKNDIVNELVDTVQIPIDPLSQNIRQDVGEYLRDLQTIQEIFKWRRFCRTMSQIVEVGASIVQLTCTVIAFIFMGIVLIQGQDIITTFPDKFKAPLVCIAGLLYFPSLVVVMYVLPKIFYSTAKFPLKVYLLMAVASLFGIALPAIIGRIEVSHEWFVLGIIMGALIDILRRHGLENGRARFDVDITKIGKDPLQFFEKIVESHWVNPLTCSLWPRQIGKVFISYTRDIQSSQSSDVYQLHETLTKYHTESFLDMGA